MWYLKFPTIFALHFKIFMKVRIIFISVILLVVNDINSQIFKLNIEIENIENKGTIYMAIYDNSSSFDQDNKNKGINKNRIKIDLNFLIILTNSSSFLKQIINKIKDFLLPDI